MGLSLRLPFPQSLKLTQTEAENSTSCLLVFKVIVSATSRRQDRGVVCSLDLFVFLRLSPWSMALALRIKSPFISPSDYVIARHFRNLYLGL